MNANNSLRNTQEKRYLIYAAWVSMLLVSDFSDILWNAFFGQVPEWLVWIKVGLLAFFFGLAHYL